MAVPLDAALMARLEALKHGSRDSLQAYRRAVPDMRRAVEDHVRGLEARGQRQHVRTGVTDAAGRFGFEGLPPGYWLVLAWASEHVDRAGRDAVKDRGGFLPQQRLAGYDRVTLWALAVEVRPGEAAMMELGGRNEWFSGVEERLVPREQAPSTGGSRRRPGL